MVNEYNNLIQISEYFKVFIRISFVAQQQAERARSLKDWTIFVEERLLVKYLQEIF